MVKSILFFVGLLGMLARVESFQFQSLMITAADYRVRAITSYTFYLGRNTDNNGIATPWNQQSVPTSANITITFPVQYSSVSSFTCSSLNINNQNVNTYTCTKSGKQIIIKNFINTNTFISGVTLVISNVMNPIVGGDTNQFVGTIGNDMVMSGPNNVVTLIANSFSSCYAEFNNTYGNTTGQLVINVVTSQLMNSSDYIAVIFPSFWTRDLAKQKLSFNPISTCSSSMASQIQCQGGTNIQAFPILIANNAFPDNAYSTTFSIYNVLSPPTNQPTNMLTISSFSFEGKPIDTCNIYPSGVIERKITNIVATPLQTPYPSSSIGITLTFSIASIMGLNDTICINFNTQYTPSFSFTNISVLSYTPSIISALGVVVNFTLNRLILAGQNLAITLYTFQAAPSMIPVSPFSISIESYGYTKMSGTFSINIQPYPVSYISLTPSQFAAAASNLYTLKFSNSGGVIQNGAIIVYLPSNMTIPADISAYNQGIKLSVTLLNDSKALQLTGFTVSSSSPTAITLQNLINLATTSPFLGTVSIKVYRTAALMDQIAFGSSQISLTFNPTDTLTAQVASSSNITSISPIVMQFLVNNKMPLPIDSSIKIQYTNILTTNISNTTVISYACQINNLLQICVAAASSIVITLNNTNIAANSSFNISIQYLFINPSTINPSLTTFFIQTYTNDNYLLQYMASSIYLTNINTPRSFNYFLLYGRTSSTNSAIANYTFVVSQYQSLLTPGSNSITIVMPSEFNIELASCENCIFDIYARTFIFPMTNTFMFVAINNVENYYNVQPISNVVAYTSHNHSYKYCQSTQLDNSIINSQASLLKVTSATYSSQIYGANAILLISIPANAISVNTKTIYIIFPWPYGISGITCSITGLVFTSYAIINQTIQIIVSSYSGSAVTINISNIVLPKSSTTLGLTITTYSNNNYIISQAQIPAWVPLCNLPCHTCSSNKSVCLSCFNDSTIVTQNLYDNISSQCRDQCLQTQLQIGLTCQPCSSPCLQCSVILTNCTKCGIGMYLHNYQCLPDCPTLYYKNPVVSLCVACVSPCQTCVTSTQCLTCLQNWFYYNGKCLNSCPINVTIASSVTRTCIACSPQCFTCVNIITNCTSCSPQLAMQNGTCVSQCENSKYIYNSACVSNCVDPCVNCSIYATRCLTCPLGFFLYNFTCVKQCPFQYYISPDSTTCLACFLLSINCDDCSNPSTCNVCNNGFVLFQSQCLSLTPIGYANVTGVAKPCQSPCATCTNLVNNCTNCSINYYHNGICLAICPISHYTDPLNHLCVRCHSPCNTCANQTACLSCLPLTNTYYVSQTMRCESNCPSQYYANALNYVCTSCIEPCVECISSTVCTSCISSTYLYNTRCITQCPSMHYAENSTNTCNKCTSPCSTCQSSSFCLSCVSGYHYLYPGQCQLQCPPGYIVNYEYNLCANCTAPCLTCSQNQCFKCNSSFIFYNETCVVFCPSNYYTKTLDDGTHECSLCSSICITCLNNSFCTSCAIGYFWGFGVDQGICVQQCPVERPILVASGCEPCQSEGCIACYPNNQCYQCNNDTILFLGFCYSQCPVGYKYNQSLATCIYDPNYQDEKNPTNLEKSVTIVMPIPMIFSIVGSGLTILSFIFAFWCRLNVWGFLACAWALPQTAAIIITTYAYKKYYIWLFLKEQIFGYIMIVGMAWLVLINLTVFSISVRTLLGDNKFKRWKKSALILYLILLTIIETATLINFKFQHLLWSGMKSTPKLQNVSKLKFLSICSAFGLVYIVCFMVSFIFLFNLAKSLFLVWLDGLIVVIVSAICSLMALKRDPKFFQQVHQDMILHRRHVSSDQLITAGIKATYRQQEYGQMNSSKQSQFVDNSSQASSRLDLASSRTSNRPFLSSLSQQLSINQRSNKNKTVDIKNKGSMGLQCSILSSGQNIHSENSKYYIECQYGSGSQHANMGSVEESQDWDGTVKEHVLQKQEYDLNKAVYLDADGKKVQAWDVESNEAVIEENLAYSFHQDNSNVEQIPTGMQQNSHIFQNQSKNMAMNNIFNTSNNSLIQNRQQPISQQKQHKQISFLNSSELRKSKQLESKQISKTIIYDKEYIESWEVEQQKEDNRKYTEILQSRLKQYEEKSKMQEEENNGEMVGQENKEIQNKSIVNKSVWSRKNMEQMNNQSRISNLSHRTKNISKFISKSQLNNLQQNEDDEFGNSELSQHQQALNDEQILKDIMMSENENNQGSMEPTHSSHEQDILDNDVQNVSQLNNSLNANKEIQIQVEGEEERWQFLLGQSKLSQKLNKSSEVSGQDEKEQYQFEEIEENLEIVNENSDQNTTNPNKQQDAEEQELEDKGEQEQTQAYLSAKMKKEIEHDNTNQFSIKTKKKKIDQPKHKVMVVNSKKFNKLKKKAVELQKQIKEGDKLKKIIEQEQEKLARPRRSSKQKTRQEQIKAIYMNDNTRMRSSQKMSPHK